MALRCQPTLLYTVSHALSVRKQAIVVVIALPDSEYLYQLMACELIQAQGYGLFSTLL